jgi:hypothetical protein
VQRVRAAEQHPLDGALERRGRARSGRVQGAPARTLVRFDDESVAETLLALGSAGAGGFYEGGLDAEGAWAVRRDPGTSLASVLKSSGRSPLDFKRAVAIGLAAAEALSACEARGLVAGLFGPESVALSVDPESEAEIAWVVCEALFDVATGALDPAAIAAKSAQYCPPAQAEGAPWDAAADRYVLGLCLYRALSGSHPFAGAGLRKALEAAATQEPPPFPEAVAASLPAGLMGLVLRMIAPRPESRPSSAEEIADGLSRFAPRRGGAFVRPAQPRPARETTPAAPAAPTLVSGRAPAVASKQLATSSPGPQASPAAGPTSRATPYVRALLPIALGLAVAGGALAQLGPAPKDTSPRPKVRTGDDDPIALAETTAQSCATCHPRQAAEWRRSVMGHSLKSPLFNALEALVEEQVGRDRDCPNGAGILRKTRADLACVDRQTGLPVSGSGGEHWCVNCHSPSEVNEVRMPPWEGRAGGDPRSRFPVRDLLGERATEGVSCGFCHTAHGPVTPRGGGYQGNPSWTSFKTGFVFSSRPEDARGLFGISNSGFDLRPEAFLLPKNATPEDGLVHRRPDASMQAYARSSEFCGSCHDVRLFGSDVLGAQKGEHFKRLRNGYSEWVAWANTERARGREPATCQGCHMSAFPGACEPSPGAEGDDVCPDGTRFVKRAPGTKVDGRVATSSPEVTGLSTHYLTGVDLPLSHEYPDDLIDETALDLAGIPVSAKARRVMLLKSAFRFEIGRGSARGGRIALPIEIENVGGGHRVPAGFSQEREIWVHLKITDARGRPVYEVGRVDRPDEDLHDKVFARVSTDPSRLDFQGRPEGLFGADVRDGPDHGEWSPRPERGGTRFTGKGLINFQNGFLRCVRCIGEIASDGTCRPGPGQGIFRADRFEDGDYDLDTGECRSNLTGDAALFETYFPVGALDASRGILKAPDAIIDTRSMPPGVPIVYTYDLDTRGAVPPFKVEARLLFRAFPPFLVKAFASYEREMDRLGKRPSGALVDEDMLKRLEVVEVVRQEATITP